jgi:hypothetical protein
MNPFDQSPAIPLTEAERAHYQAEAERGNPPSLEIVRRFVATIRKSITESPIKLEKTAKSRNKKVELTEDQIDFF